MTGPPLPKQWSYDELSADRERAIEAFIQARLVEGDPVYREMLSESLRMAKDLFDCTQDLSRLEASCFVDTPKLLTDIARFTGGPPVSEDDLKTLSGCRSCRTLEQMTDTLTVIRGLIDRARFPWLSDDRPSTDEERRVALISTASLRAVERTRTIRRGEQKGRQEPTVMKALVAAGMQAASTIADVDDDLKPGMCKHGIVFEGEQCDVLARLWDKRFLAIECKSTNTEVNSRKRLNDAGNKATLWRQKRGEKVVTAAVLAGVFKLSDLERSQHTQRVSLFWEHDLGPLQDFVRSTLPS